MFFCKTIYNSSHSSELRSIGKLYFFVKKRSTRKAHGLEKVEVGFLRFFFFDHENGSTLFGKVFSRPFFDHKNGSTLFGKVFSRLYVSYGNVSGKLHF